MNIWISVVLITGLVNFFFHFDIVMEWNVTNHIITYLRTQSLALRIMLIVISLIVWVFLVRGWWIYSKSKAKEL